MKKLFLGTRKLTAVILSAVVIGALCITCFGIGVTVNSDPYIVAVKGSKLVIDNTNNVIIGVKKGISGLGGYVEIGGDGKLLYSQSGVLTKYTKVSVYDSTYTVKYAEYSIAFRGDVDRDGSVDADDVSAIAKAAKCAEVPEAGSVRYEIMDINCDGYIDAQDLLLARALQKGLTINEATTKSGGIDEDYWD